MNIRGRVINKYINEQPEKFKARQRAINPYIGYEHKERMDSLVITAFILANRDKIASAAINGYRKIKSPEEVVKGFYERKPSDIHEVCCLEMGFNVSEKDIDNKCILDFSIYIPHLDEALLNEVNRVYREIDSKTPSLF
jgi:hypothetical protein